MNDDLTVEQALAEFHSQYQLDLSAYQADRFTIKLGSFRLHLPNPGRLFLHDLHHIALGAPPSFWGEVEVSAFELRTGAATPFITFLCIAALLLGFLWKPKRILAAWKVAKGARNLYQESTSYELLLRESLSDLKKRLHLAIP